MSKNDLILLGRKIKKGESICLQFEVAKLHTRNKVQVPVFIERGKKKGPVLLLLGGVHGDEINGVEIVRRIIRSKINKPDRGTIICIPVFNIFGFLNLSRKFPDGRDLNRVFPGSPKGSLASQFAFHFRTEIAPFVDYVIDFHSGGAHRVNFAQTRCRLDDPASLDLAKAFGAPFIVHANTIRKSLRETFARLGTPAVIYEGGKSMLYDEAAIEAGVQGARNVIRYLKMKKPDPKSGKPKPKKKKQRPKKPVVITRSKWLRAPYSGMFHVRVQNGTWVTEKTVLGIITDPFGDFEKKVRAPFEGYVFCINISPIVNKGDALFHLSLEVE